MMGVGDKQSKEMIDEFDCPQGKLNSVSYINGRVWSCADDSSICIWDRTVRYYPSFSFSSLSSPLIVIIIDMMIRQRKWCKS